MAFEITYFFHPRKEEGGYDTTKTEEKSEKVGKAFEETPLAKAAAAIMGQLARRDVWVVDVKVVELVKKEIAYKESKDGKGIVLKNKKFSLNGPTELNEENVGEDAPRTALPTTLPPGVHPHELINQPSLDDLYSNPNKVIPVKTQTPINTNKRPLYYVYFEPELAYEPRAKQMGLKFKKEKKYPVYAVTKVAVSPISPTGQQLSLIDDTGKVANVDEIFFQTVGAGLLADAQLGFSKPTGEKGAKLMYDKELVLEMPQQNRAAAQAMYPVDNGEIPDDLMAMPNIRPTRR